MALSLIYSITDAKNKTSSTSLSLPDTVTLANATAFGASMATLINNIITGAITGVSLSADIPLPGGLRATAEVGADKEEGARFSFRTENNFLTKLRITTFDETKMLAGTANVDLTDNDVNAFRLAITGGIDVDPGAGTTLVSPVDSRGEDIESLSAAVEAFQSSAGS